MCIYIAVMGPVKTSIAKAYLSGEVRCEDTMPLDMRQKLRVPDGNPKSKRKER